MGKCFASTQKMQKLELQATVKVENTSQNCNALGRETKLLSI